MSSIRKQMAEAEIAATEKTFSRVFAGSPFAQVSNIHKAQIHKYYADIEKDAQKQIKDQEDLRLNGFPGLYDELYG